MTAAGRRFLQLTKKVAQDSTRAVRDRQPAADGLSDAAVPSGVDWLLRSHLTTGKQGSSRGYSLLKGWAPAFPETTGYVIGTLVAYAQRDGHHRRDEVLVHAREMADWELKMQEPDGGIMQGLVTNTPRRSIAFNTGMVMHGWLDLWQAEGDGRYLEAARRGGEWLVERQQPDGTWRGEASYRGIPHTYKSRVAWALLRLADATAEDEFRQAAIRNLDWVLSTQQPNGWFEHCIFEPGSIPNTHGIAYTLRGLVESFALTGDERYLAAAKLTSGVLIEQLERRGTLPATWRADWTTAARYRCLTGIAQLGGVWLRMYELTGDETFKQGGLRAVEHAAAYQLHDPDPDLRGALPGSFPIFGLYAPLACPNWATKFLLDGLMLRERVCGDRDSAATRPVWG